MAEEFVERCRRGESPSVDEYLERYPEHAETIRKLLPAVAMIERLGRGAVPQCGAAAASAHPIAAWRFPDCSRTRPGGDGGCLRSGPGVAGRKVALKVIHQVQLDARRLERFHREAHAIAGFTTRTSCPSSRWVSTTGCRITRCSTFAGADSMRWSTNGGVTKRQSTASAAVRGADRNSGGGGLQYAHEQGILHRDVKPANLLVDEQQSVWITDFGLAKLAGQDDLTRSGDVIGTLRYLAPEALGGRTGPENDIYSLGLTLYELITLNSPFGDVSASELLRRVSESQPTRPRKLDPSIPRDLETIVLKAIAPEPGDRYPTALELADDLRCFVEDRPIRRVGRRYSSGLIRWSRRNRAMAGLAATAASALLFAAIVGWVGYASTRQRSGGSDRNVELSLAVFGELFDRLSPDEDFFPPPTGRRVHRPRPAGPIERRRPPGGEGELGPSFEGGEGDVEREGPGRGCAGGDADVGPPIEGDERVDARPRGSRAPAATG